MGIEICHVVLITTFTGNFLTMGMSQALPAVYYSLWLDAAGVEAGLTALISSTNLGLVGITGETLLILLLCNGIVYCSNALHNFREQACILMVLLVPIQWLVPPYELSKCFVETALKLRRSYCWYIL